VRYLILITTAEAFASNSTAVEQEIVSKVIFYGYGGRRLRRT
jgi:hypothetical protein